MNLRPIFIITYMVTCRPKSYRWLPLGAGLGSLAGCECAASLGPQLVGEDLADLPLAGSDEQQRRDFRAGDALFETAFRDSDGLGPLYIRTACGACHENAGKGPGLVRKLQVVGPDGVTPVDAPEDLPWGNTLRPYTAGGATRPLLAPEALPDGHQLLRRASASAPPCSAGVTWKRSPTRRLSASPPSRAPAPTAPPGRIARLRGRQHRPLRPEGPAGHAGGVHRRRVPGRHGPDQPAAARGGAQPRGPGRRSAAGPRPATAAAVTAVATYIRLLEIPTRDPRAAAGPGPALFAARRAAPACHVPSLRTRADHPVPQLAGIQAPLYSDLLLHDMGERLADGITEADAGPREWRTPPLIGLRFQRSLPARRPGARPRAGGAGPRRARVPRPTDRSRRSRRCPPASGGT